MERINDKRYRPTSIRKNENGKWTIFYTYFGEEGKLCHTSINGFKNEKDALEWQQEALPYLIHKRESLYLHVNPLTMGELIQEYMKYSKARRRNSTVAMKEGILQLKILPFFKDKRVFEITKNDIRIWQDTVLDMKKADGSCYAPSYIQLMNNQMSALMNYAVQYHDLPHNPVRLVEAIGSREGLEEREFWTLEEYQKFSEVMEEKPEYYYAFEVFFWCGIRLGELLALTKEDLDLDADLLHVRGSYSPLNGDDKRTKTVNSLRTIHMPHELTEELQDYLDTIYTPEDHEPLFPTSKSALHRAMTYGAAKAGVKRITLHGMRHSHISLLMNSMENTSVLDIAKRAGHKSPDVTMIYTHQYSHKDAQIASELDTIMQEK